MKDEEPRQPEAAGRKKDGESTLPTLAFSATQHRAAWAEASDYELLCGLKREDEAALNELIQRKTRPLTQLALRIVGDLEEARDIVQVTFFRLWENRDKFDERWSPNTWIYRIATNLAIDQFRSRRSRDRAAEPVRRHLYPVATDHHREFDRLGETEVGAIFRELAAGLSEKQRLVFLLREVEGLPSQEVAAIVGCRESTVRNHLFNARKNLQAELLRRYPEYASRHREATP